MAAMGKRKKNHLANRHEQRSSSMNLERIPRKRLRNYDQGPPTPTELRYRLSPIELLPNEILTKIFLFSFNPSLPLASDFLGASLSSEYVKRRYCAYVFCKFQTKTEVANRLPTPCSVDRVTRFNGNAPKKHADSVAPLTPLRSIALGARWMTSQFFNDVRKEAIERERARIRANLQTTPYLMKLAQEAVNLDLTGCHIPRRLLRSPANEDQLMLLKQYLQLGAAVDHQSYNAELVKTLWYWILDTGRINVAMYMALDKRIRLDVLRLDSKANGITLMQSCPLDLEGFDAFMALTQGSLSQALVCDPVQRSPEFVEAALEYSEKLRKIEVLPKKVLGDLRDAIIDFEFKCADYSVL